jgi:hypothetical protein
MPVLPLVHALVTHLEGLSLSQQLLVRRAGTVPVADLEKSDDDFRVTVFPVTKEFETLYRRERLVTYTLGLSLQKRISGTAEDVRLAAEDECIELMEEIEDALPDGLGLSGYVLMSLGDEGTPLTFGIREALYSRSTFAIVLFPTFK